MRTLLFLACLLALQDPPRDVLRQQYTQLSGEAIARQLESPSRAVYRYRAAIVNLLQLKPGMTAVDVGAGSGFIARTIAQQVGPEGRAIAVELEPKLVAYMNARATQEGLANFTAVQGRVDGPPLDAASVDAVSMVNTFSYLEKPDAMLLALAAVLKPTGVLVVVDLPREGQGASAVGIDAEEVVRMAEAAGFTRQTESSIVPGQYALRFRKR